MEVENVLWMNGGDGETSYANNSLLPETVISKVRPLLEETIKDMFSNAVPSCFKLADLGCSSGHTTFLVISEILDTIYEICQQKKCRSPEFQVFLNDLPGNDFNAVFKLLPPFYEKLKKEKGDFFGPCFVSGVPGSFYGRLFPSKSLHFFHSSCSIHWLSKVPEGIANNKGNIYMAKSSPPNVFRAYLEQFTRDFSQFLSLRSEEIIPGGHMVLTIIGRSIEDPTSKDCCYRLELLARSLIDLVVEGLVDEVDVDTFNIPLYTPCEGEIRAIVQEEGSFNIDRLEIIAVNWDPSDDVNNKDFVFNKYQSGKNVSNCVRAVTEPILASHFGGHIIDKLFNKYTKHVADHLSVEKTKFVSIALSMTKN